MRSFLTHTIGTALYATASARHALASLPAVVGARTALSNAASTVSEALAAFWQDIKEAQAYAPVEAASRREDLAYAALSDAEAEVLRLRCALDAAHEREKEALADLRAASRHLAAAADAYYGRPGANAETAVQPPEDALSEEDRTLLAQRKEFLEKYPNHVEAPEHMGCKGCTFDQGGLMCQEAPCLSGDAIPGVIYLHGNDPR